MLDARARMVRLELGDQTAATKLAPVTAVYDGSGLVEMRQGDQVVSYERDAAGRAIALEAADGERLEYDYDAADRLTARRYPGGRTYGYGYDADGVLTSRTLPSGKSHVFTPTGWKQYISAWTPPGGAGAYGSRARRRRGRAVGELPERGGADRHVRRERAHARSRPAGRRRGASATRVARTASRPTSRPPRPAGASQGLTAETDGMQLTTLTATGLAPAVTTFARSATTLDVTSVDLDVPGADPPALALSRDADGVPTGFGGFTYERNGPDRTLSAITDGTGRTEETIDEVADLTTRVLKVGGAERYRLELGTDDTGRIISRREVTAGGDHTYTYEHDEMGALEEVRRDGVLTEAYEYDLDGDRTQRTLAAGAARGGDLRRRRQAGVARRRPLHLRRRRLPGHSRRRHLRLRPQRRPAVGHRRRHHRRVRLRRDRPPGRPPAGRAAHAVHLRRPRHAVADLRRAGPGRHARPLPVRAAGQPPRHPAREPEALRGHGPGRLAARGRERRRGRGQAPLLRRVRRRDRSRPGVLPADRVRRRAARPGDEARPLRPARLRAGVRALHLP